FNHFPLSFRKWFSRSIICAAYKVATSNKNDFNVVYPLVRDIFLCLYASLGFFLDLSESWLTGG
ncbi:MAG: hypothetical protein ACK52X_05580, partial [bacterium]